MIAVSVDMLLPGRTSKDSANQHAADLMTDHRIQNFRSTS
jgi:hypothetical protein